MEKYLLENFERELNQIKEYIKHIQKVDDLIGIEVQNEPVFQIFKTHFLTFHTDKKVFEYKAVIISLYGLLEKYIDLWIKEYLKCVSRIVTYDKLNEKIINNHFEFSLKLINIVKEGRNAKYNGLEKKDILKKLNKCLENQQPYELNVDAFTLQSGNLTHTRIEEIFKTIDIGLTKELIKNPALITLIGLSAEQIQKTESDILFRAINELVIRRNTIAHGAIIDDLLSLTELEPYIEFLDKYCSSIFVILEEKVLEAYTIEKYQIISCEGIFKEKTIIGISLENHTIKLGDYLIIKTAELNNEHFYQKEIKSIGVDCKNDYAELVVGSTTKVAVEISNIESLPITTNCSFYLEKQ